MQGEQQRMSGAAYVVGAMCFFSLNDALIKFLSSDYALHEIVLIRAVGAIVLITLFASLTRQGIRQFKTKNLTKNLMRGLLVVLANLTFFVGLAAMELAEAVAIFFVSPMLISLFSVIFLGERVGPRRWVAVAVGFVGVLIIVQPGTDAFQPVAILPIIAAVCYAGLHMFTRVIGRTEGALSMTFWIQVVFIVTALAIGLAFGDGRFGDQSDPSLAFFFRAWRWPDPQHAPLFLGIIVALTFSGYLISRAYSVSEAALVAPFEYVALPLSVAWGFLIFDEWPGANTWMGILLIAGSGLFLLWRESRTDASSTPPRVGFRR